MGHIRRGTALVLAAGLVLGVSCGSDIGDDGLPTHCDRTVSTVIDHTAGPDAGPTVSFENAVWAVIRRELPGLQVSFPSNGPGDLSNDTNQVHPLQISDVANGRRASLKNANGVRMLSVVAGEYGGTWIVDSTQVCQSMKKKFRNP